MKAFIFFLNVIQFRQRKQTHSKDISNFEFIQFNSGTTYGDTKEMNFSIEILLNKYGECECATSRTISEHMFPFSSCSCFKDTIDELMWFLGQSTSIVNFFF